MRAEGGTGIPSLIDEMQNASFEELRASTVAADGTEPSFYAKADLAKHVDMLATEFSGASRMLLYHATLIVLIRREIDTGSNVERFRRLWESEVEFLCRELDSRWLVSACDTIADHWDDRAERAIAVAGSLFTNAVKLYETERWATGQDRASPPDYSPVESRIVLHDGLTAFMIGRGNMVKNLLARARALSQDGSIAAQILMELLDRANRHDTVFGRFRARHVHEPTRW